MFCSILCNNLNKKFKKSKKYFQKQVANIQSLNILSLTVQTLWGLCENSAFRFQMTWASHTDDALWRKHQNLCSLYWWHLRKLVPLFFSTLCLIYAWLMGVGVGGGRVAVMQWGSVSPLSDLNRRNHERAAIIWHALPLQPGCLCLCVCCPALHHPPVTVQNRTRWCVFHLQTPACGWQAVQVCSHRKGGTQLDYCPVGGVHPPTRHTAGTIQLCCALKRLM